MKKSIFLFAIVPALHIHAQTKTPNDGVWSKQYVVLKNTAEADWMIRVGDIDNLSFGWAEGFNPFSGRATEPHGYPWDIDKADAKGTDRIIVPSSYKYGGEGAYEGYTGNTQRPANNPVAIILPLKDIKDAVINSAALQLFIDDFQSPEFQSHFKFTINGVRFIEAEKMIAGIDQKGPIGKLIRIQLTDEFLPMLKGDSLSIFIDDPVTGMGDGFAIDFVKLLINPKVIYRGAVKGSVVDINTQQPIARARVEVPPYSNVVTDKEGKFTLENIPAGLNIVTASASGYSSASKQTDVIADETGQEELLLELKPSGKVTYNNKSLQEGDQLVLNNIQFELNSAELLAAGKQELNKLAAFMKENNSVEILLSGHTSAEGSAVANRQLSLKRVRSCKDYLISKGIAEDKITIKGYGPDMPVAPNDTEGNRAKNRRVEMKITKL